MPLPGRFFRSKFGPDDLVLDFVEQGSTSYAMAPLNTGLCWRFTAPDTRDIWSVWMNWATVSSPGAFSLRIETIDTTNGKPTGTLYDANATKTGNTPTAGWQQVTFASHPTTGLVAGNEYGAVILTTTGGTTQTIRRNVGNDQPSSSLPTIALTAADGTTRTNFAEVANSLPCVTFGMSDGNEECFATSPYATFAAVANIFSTTAGSLQMTVPGGLILKAVGYELVLTRTGTPAGDLRIRLMDSSGNVVAASTYTVSKGSLLNSTGHRLRCFLPAPIYVPGGTYYIALDSASSANSSNCWALTPASARAAGLVPAAFSLATTSDITANPPVWSATATSVPPVALMLDDILGHYLGNP